MNQIQFLRTGPRENLNTFHAWCDLIICKWNTKQEVHCLMGLSQLISQDFTIFQISSSQVIIFNPNICSFNRAWRGIDFPNVDHIELVDFPRDPREYVRHVGRTARGARGTGTAFVFVVRQQISLARRIMERNKKGHPLHDVPSAYELESFIL